MQNMGMIKLVIEMVGLIFKMPSKSVHGYHGAGKSFDIGKNRSMSLL